MSNSLDHHVVYGSPIFIFFVPLCLTFRVGDADVHFSIMKKYDCIVVNYFIRCQFVLLFNVLII